MQNTSNGPAQLFPIFGDFKDWDDIKRNFEGGVPNIEDITLIFAWYDYANYEGSSLVIYYQNGAYWLNSAGHCSCNGLEGSWSPDKFETLESLKRTLEGSYYVKDEHRSYIDQVLAVHKEQTS